MNAVYRTKHAAGSDFMVEVTCQEKPSFEAEGRWDSRSSGYSINMSSILTKLIQEAGRWCEAYASDLFIMYGEVRKDLEQYKERSRRLYGFGMHRSGIHDAFEVAYNTRGIFMYHTYRAVWGLLVEKCGDSVKASLFRIDRISIRSADDTVMTRFAVDWDTELACVEHGHELSEVIGYGLTRNDISGLAALHKAGKHRKKIEELLTDCNFHTECRDFAAGSCDKYNKYI